jgi:hypothetical protein
MRKPFCCESNRHMFDQYYTDQQHGKGDFPIYVGTARQQGHGIGNIIGSLLRRVLPSLKALAPIALRGGANYIDNLNSGKTWKQASFTRGPDVVNYTAKAKKEQTGEGARRRRTKRKRAAKHNKSAKKHTKKCKRDIFS